MLRRGLFSLLSCTLGGLLLLALFTVATTSAHSASPIPQSTNSQSTSSQSTPSPFGLCFVSAADNLAPEIRYAGALESGAAWDRWPLYWHWVDESGYVGSYNGVPYDYDTLVSQDISHGLRVLAILLGTAGQRASGGSWEVPFPRVSQKLFLHPELIPQDGLVSFAATPPRDLYAPIFADGTDDYAPGKVINAGNSWAEFVSATVQRYMPGGDLAQAQGWPEGVGIRHWEIWNEPDLDQFWNGTVEEFYRLLEVGYKAAKAVDPECTIVLGGLAIYEKPDWFPQLLDLIPSPEEAYFDVLGYHYYWSIYDGEYHMVRLRDLLDAHGLTHIPIWMTESGVSVWDDYPGPRNDPNSPYRGTMVEQAAYVIQNAALARYHGLERVFHFMLHDDCGNGCTDADGDGDCDENDPPGDAFGLRQNFGQTSCFPAQGRKRPSYTAYQVVAREFRDLTPLWRQKSWNQDRVAFARREAGERVLVLWATQGVTATAVIPAITDTARLLWVEPFLIDTGYTGITRTATITAVNGYYTITLPPATNQNSLEHAQGQPEDRYFIGGPPYIVIEEDGLPPTSSVDPLPPLSPPTFTVTWHGSDSIAGIESYDLWYAVDYGAWQPWLTATTSTSATFSGQVGHRYGFIVRARDRKGNEEAMPTAPQAETYVAEGAVLYGQVVDNIGQPVEGAVVTVHTRGSTAVITRTYTTAADGYWLGEYLPSGPYAVDATAAGYGHWPQPRYVDLADTPQEVLLPLRPFTDVIINGDFESGGTLVLGWEVLNGEVWPARQAFDGEWALRLGDYPGQPITCIQNGQPGFLWTVAQTVTVPLTIEQPILSFVYALSTTQEISASQGVTTGAWLEVLLLTEGEPHPVELGYWREATDWRLAHFDLSHWQGQRVSLLFQVVQCSSQSRLWATIDRVSLGPAQRIWRVWLPLVMKRKG